MKKAKDEDFLPALYRHCEGGRIELRAFCRGPKPWRAFFPPDDPRAALDAAKTKAETGDAYYGVALRKQGRGGGKADIAQVPALWVDLDYKGAQRPDVERVLAGCVFLPSAVVDSGGGYHLYWFLKEPETPENLPAVEEALRKLAHHLGGDFASAEAARILRPPGTLNHKYDPPRLVRLLMLRDFAYELDAFADLPSPPVVRKSPGKSKIHNEEKPPERIARILSCRFMAHCEQDAATLSEPEWLAMITQLCREPGGVGTIHALSRPYPEYAKKETDDKILHALQCHGPVTCAYIRNLWDCGERCGVRSPAALAWQGARARAGYSYEYEKKPLVLYSDADSGSPGGTDFADNNLNIHNNQNESPARAPVADRLRDGCRPVAGAVRNPRRPVPLTDTLRAFVEDAEGTFSTRDAYEAAGARSPSEKSAVRLILTRLNREGVIVRTGPRSGVYRPVAGAAPRIDFLSARPAPLPVVWPLGVHKLVSLFPKSVAVLAGESNAGKTAFLLNFIRENRHLDREIIYFSSEMGDMELRDRLMRFPGMELTDWNFTARSRSRDFADVIQPEAVNIIDYLEMSDSFYTLGGDLSAVFNRLTTGMAVIAIQKDHRSGLGRGGAFGLEKPRLYMTLQSPGRSGGRLTLVKAKHWADPGKNPNGLSIRFSIENGCTLTPLSGWEKPHSHEPYATPNTRRRP